MTRLCETALSLLWVDGAAQSKAKQICPKLDATLHHTRQACRSLAEERDSWLILTMAHHPNVTQLIVKPEIYRKL